MSHPASRSILLVISICLALLGVLAPRDCPAEGPPTDGLQHLDFREVIQFAKGKVFPAVVFIKCIRESLESGQRATQEVAGSGVIIGPTGEVLTNWHVVEDAIEVRCLLLDGRAFEARVQGQDKDTDLALLALDLEQGETVPHAEMGDSTEAQEGDFVMAMGAPWGLSRSVAIGIVSCTDRFLPDQSEYALWLQTDAAISPGNSGGPLVNTKGQVIGITTLGSLIGGDLGFAVPTETMQYVLPQLRRYGRVNWSWTGLQLQPLRDFNKNIYFEGTEGVIVAETDPESPAREAGIKAQDRLLSVNGKPLNAVSEEALPPLRRRLGLLPKHEPALVELRRNGERLTVELVPREKGEVKGEELACPRWDFTVKTINQFENPELYFYRKQGVFVYGVKRPGNAMIAGLLRNDILLKIDDREVNTLEDVESAHEAALASTGDRKRVVLTVLRNGLARQLVLDFTRDFERER